VAYEARRIIEQISDVLPPFDDNLNAVCTLDRLLSETFSFTDRMYEETDWPNNQPAGMTQLVYADGSTKYFDPNASYGTKWDNDNRVTVVTDTEAKYGNKAIEKRFFVGDNDGWNGGAFDPNWPGSYSEVYIRVVLKFSSNWDAHPAHTHKILYWGYEKTHQANGNYIEANDAGGYPMHILFRNQGGGGADNAVFKANNSKVITLNEYHTYEVHMVANTPGVANGSARVWIDGTEYTDWNKQGYPNEHNIPLTNREWVGSGDSTGDLDGYEAFLYWGGGSGTKSANDWVRLSELLISGKN
jgi:hypothetical protein